MVSDFTSRLNTRLYRSGDLCFDEHTLHDLDDRLGLGSGRKYTIMAACPGNPLLSQDDLDRAVSVLEEAGQALAVDMTAAIASGQVTPQGGHPAGPAGWNEA